MKKGEMQSKKERNHFTRNRVENTLRLSVTAVCPCRIIIELLSVALNAVVFFFALWNSVESKSWYVRNHMW